MAPAGLLRGARAPRDGAVAAWLWFIAALVFAMIVVGGATRLTDSGLSITEWQPILGAIPPLSEADWQLALEKYRQIPEYQLINKGMSLEEFKVIYWWEWGHRFLGRLIGIAFALPLVFFWLTGALREGLGVRLTGIFLLGGLQGAIGWYMVMSGLVDRVDVSQYRLALHLFVAFLIFGLVVWTALGLKAPPRSFGAGRAEHSALATLAMVLIICLYAQVVLGAFVAGTKAGLAYNTWPDMNGEFIPSDLATMQPWWRNLFEDITTIQFNHRMFSYFIALLAVINLVAALVSRATAAITSALAVALAIAAQMVIGIWTLLNAVPLNLGLAHQGGAAIVLAIALWHWHRMLRLPDRKKLQG